ncbi:MAG: GNAT family N-acetyltransferase [Novosphingobium sp.]
MTQIVLTTERFDLRPPARGDLDGLIALIADEETRRFLGPATADVKSQGERLLRNAGSWALYGYGTFMVRRHGEEQIIGSCGVFHSWRGFGQGMDDVPEAGWIIHRDAWGQGVAVEVMRAVLGWFDEAHGPRRIACMIEDGHTGSERVAAKLGFVRYGRQEPEDGAAALNLFERQP